MPKENDLEGRQDMGGKHGGQAGMPKSEAAQLSSAGVARDEKGQGPPSPPKRRSACQPQKPGRRSAWQSKTVKRTSGIEEVMPCKWVHPEGER